jgi:ABC-type oligopeptide transport system substrate-binding subunit
MFVTDNGNNETGWSNARYDDLVNTANQTVDLKKREQLFQQAESILVSNDVPIIPLYIYVGVNYFDTNKVQGIWENVLDDHPLRSIRKVKPQS